MDSWQIEVLLEKIIQHHDCKKCNTKTIWYLSIILDPNTGNKNLVWWCSFCFDTIYEDIGPFVPN